MGLNIGADDANDLIFDDLDDEFEPESSSAEEEEKVNDLAILDRSMRLSQASNESEPEEEQIFD